MITPLFANELHVSDWNQITKSKWSRGSSTDGSWELCRVFAPAPCMRPKGHLGAHFTAFGLTPVAWDPE